jgi:hypothetical protein
MRHFSYLFVSLGADKLLCKIFSGFQAKFVSLIYHNPVTPHYKCTMMESSYKNIGLSAILLTPPAKLTSLAEAQNSPPKVRVSVRGKIVQVGTN